MFDQVTPSPLTATPSSLQNRSISQNPEIFGNSGNASITSTMQAKMTGIVEDIESIQLREFRHSTEGIENVCFRYIRYLRQCR